MKKAFLGLLVLYTGGAKAAGSVDFLEVDNDVVLFSTTEAKTGTRPACMTVDNNALWSVSLASESGRAMYSLILTAMAKGDSVGLAVESAADCANKDGVERASKVNLAASGGSQSGKDGGGFYVYTGDGQTKLGRLIKYDALNKFQYIPDGDSAFPVSLSTYYRLGELYFEQDSCMGDPLLKLTSNYMFANPSHNDGRFFARGASLGQRSSKSRYSALGVCESYSQTTTYYSTLEASDSICGNSPCIFKDE